MMPLDRKRFLAYAGVIVVLALLVREYYVLVAQVRHPYSGDPREYIAYAEHLLQGWFGKGNVPDAYRTPGYPVFVMLTMLWEGDWYPRLLQAQAVLGTLTVVGVMALARQWLSRGWALLAGLLLALWPHHIAASAEILSEVLLGAVIVAALYLTTLAQARRSLPLSVAAGVAYGIAYLVNPIMALFPLVVAAVLWRDGLRKHGLALAAVSLAVLLGWNLRGIDGGTDRAYINLVQGSYPLYHKAYVSRKADPVPARIINEIDAESALMVSDHAAGIRAMRERMGREPAVYLRWYASKIYLLWDWNIRIGDHDVYVHEVYKSPLEGHPLLRATTSILKAANPWLFALSLAFALATFWRSRPEQVIALLFLYLTGMHTVLQAEPRYSVAYRPVELILAVGALSALAARVIAYRKAVSSPASGRVLRHLHGGDGGIAEERGAAGGSIQVDGGPVV